MDFELPQIVAAIEKFDYSVNQIFSSVSESGYKSSICALFELINNDNVLTHIYSTIETKFDIDVESWIREYTKRESGLGQTINYKLPEFRERIILIYKMMADIYKSASIMSYSKKLCSTTIIKELLDCFAREFIGTFARDVRNLLVDLRVVAELSGNKNIPETKVLNIILGGKNQLNQGNEMDDNSQINQD